MVDLTPDISTIMIEKVTLGEALSAAELGTIANYIGIYGTDVRKNTPANLRNNIGLTSSIHTVASGEEKDLGEMGYGLYFVSCGTTGWAASYAIASFPVASSDPEHFGDFSSNTNANILFGRKSSNGSFFLKNNSSSTYEVRIARIWFTS